MVCITTFNAISVLIWRYFIPLTRFPGALYRGKIGKIAYIVGGGRVQYQTDTYRKLVSAKLIVLGVSVISFT
jgi:hypothetical protein